MVTTYSANIEEGQTVIVIPFNKYLHQIEAANKVEMALVNYGFAVKSYQPEIKQVEEHTGAAVTGSRTQSNLDASGAIGAGANKLTIERYFSYENNSADLVFEVLTSGSNMTIKVVRTRDKTVIGVTNFYRSSFNSTLRKFLLEKNLIVEKVTPAD